MACPAAVTVAGAADFTSWIAGVRVTVTAVPSASPTGGPLGGTGGPLGGGGGPLPPPNPQLKP